MKIAIDARWIFPQISGIGTYTRELIRHLARIDHHNTYYILYQNRRVMQRTAQETDIGRAPNFRMVHLRYGIFSPLNQAFLPSRLRRMAIDVYHSTNYMMPLPGFRAGRSRPVAVTTIHDVIPLLFPDHAPRSKKARLFTVYRTLMRLIGLRARAIITDSSASTHDIVRLLGIPTPSAGKVHAIPCGVSERFHPPPHRRAKGPAEPRELLYVGRADPYKNLVTLVRAFAAARPRLPFPASLTLAGAPDRRYPEALQAAAAAGLADHVRWTGYLSDDALVQRYQQADLLVHPSHYEGFGLQIVEAMASGLPVLCSNAGSLPEVAGDAAILCDPKDVTAFADGIVAILTDPARAADLATRGLAQAAKFTWPKTAEATLRVYELVGR